MESLTKYERELKSLVEGSVQLENYDLVTQGIIKKLFDKKIEAEKKAVNTGGIGYMAQAHFITEILDELGLLEECRQYYYKNSYATEKGNA